jgi:hypothetical protein
MSQPSKLPSSRNTEGSSSTRTLPVGHRCTLVNLRRCAELNNQIGTITARDDMRATVTLDSGRIISTSQANCQLSSEPLRGSELPLMDWGPHGASVQAFLEPWARQIAVQDPVGWNQSGTDVYSYLVHKVKQIASTVKKPRQAGYAFSAADPRDIVPAAVWTDGTKHTQESELQCHHQGHQYGEKWWPCIVLAPHTSQLLNFVAESPTQANATSGLVPFYCPVLGINGARPWEVNVSRIRRVLLSLPTVPTQIGTQYFADPITPGPVITELSVTELSDTEDEEASTSWYLVQLKEE